MVASSRSSLALILWLAASAGVARGSISQTSPVGEPGLVRFDMQVAGGASQCTPLLAEGDLLKINTSLYFIGGIESLSTYASDMFLVVKELNESTGEFIRCLQYGGWDYVYPQCGLISKWPSSWSKHLAGWYNYTADVSRAEFSGSSWEVCVGNGYETANVVSYSGSLYFTDSLITTGVPPSSSPTSMPSSVPTISSKPTSIPSGIPSPVPTKSIPPSATPSTMPSVSVAPTALHWIVPKCSTPLKFDFDVSLAGTEYSCITVPATGVANSVNMSLYFSGSTGLEWPYDMAFAVKAVSGFGAQVGGFEYYLPNISYAGPWPFEWRSPVEGWYFANVSVANYGVEGQGDYTVCIVNAWVEASTITYQGNVLVDGLTYDCTLSPSPAPTPIPTSDPTWTLEGECGANTQLSYNLQLSGFQSSCFSLDAAGFIQFLNISMYFSGSVNGEWPSDMSLAVKFEDGLGFRIGGFNDEDPDLVYLGAWPPSWRNSSSGTYEAFMNISSALIIDSGEVDICITNGWEYAKLVRYDGQLELLGLIRACDKKKQNNDDDGNETALALGLSIPLVLLAVGLITYFVVSAYHRQQRRKKEALLTGPQLSGDVSPVGVVSSYAPPTSKAGAYRSESESGL